MDLVSIERLKITYMDRESRVFELECEPVVSDEYDLAVYIDSLCDEEGNKVVETSEVNRVLYRVEKLAEMQGPGCAFTLMDQVVVSGIFQRNQIRVMVGK